MGADGLSYVLADATAERLSPARWAKRAVDLFHQLEADRIVAEVNQGGEMVEAVIRQADESVPVETVRAYRGKYLRAEPVAALYEKGRVKHVGAFPELEDEMCDFALGGLSSGRSPDRLDALVWALSALMLTKEGKPRVRGILPAVEEERDAGDDEDHAEDVAEARRLLKEAARDHAGDEDLDEAERPDRRR